MRVRWQVEDGYAGGSRPQYTEIDNEEIRDVADNPAEVEELIREYVQHDFEALGWFYCGYEDVPEDLEDVLP